MAYVVPFKFLLRLVKMSAEGGEMRVTIGYDEFKAAVRLLLRSVAVDEEWYCGHYEDVAAAIRDGTCRSAREHFIADGYFEGRLPGPHQVDEAWYTRQYDDAAEGIRSGDFASAAQHYVEYGYEEGRLPAAR